MRYMSWTAYYTAVDFHPRRRFPRAAAEPRRFRPYRVSLAAGVFALLSNQLLEGTKQIKLYSQSQKNEPLIKPVD